ncbi:hypothetical protein ACLOJK_016985 [Asimina triloba]
MFGNIDYLCNQSGRKACDYCWRRLKVTGSRNTEEIRKQPPIPAQGHCEMRGWGADHLSSEVGTRATYPTRQQHASHASRGAHWHVVWAGPRLITQESNWDFNTWQSFFPFFFRRFKVRTSEVRTSDIDSRGGSSPGDRPGTQRACFLASVPKEEGRTKYTGSSSQMGIGEKECEAASSAKWKFMCSYGGKILPRPSDGQYKYVGGTTRVVSVPRDITLSELKKRVCGMGVDGERLLLKYQLIPGELDDALVSVTCDEDLRHMLEEHDRRARVSSTTGGGEGGPSRLLRTFIFPCTTPLINLSDGYQAAAGCTYPLEQLQRYIDAINGVVRNYNHNHNHSSSSSPLFTISPCPSPGSSPTSIAPRTSFNSDPDDSRVCSGSGSRAVHKVCSLPNLNSVGSRQQNYCHRRYRHGHPKNVGGVRHVDGLRGSRGVGAGVQGEGDGLALQRPVFMKHYWGSPTSPSDNIR